MLKLATLIYTFILVKCVLSDYWQERNAFINNEATEMLGSSLVLTQQEEAANKILMSHKLQEYDTGFEDPSKFNPRRHFFEARKDIEASDVFKIIREMPKGGALHAHDFTVVSQEYFMNLTYREDLYGCQVNGELNLKFLRDPKEDSSCTWMLLSKLREKDPYYDKYIQSQFFLNAENPQAVYPHNKAVWKKLTSILKRTTDFFGYQKVFQEHFYQTLKEFYNDNVKYYEFRSTFPKIYDFHGKTYNAVEITRLYQDTLSQFQKDHPDFIGARLIYGIIRRQEYIGVDLQNIVQLNELFPDFLAGFDFSGDEDLGKPLSHFIDYIKLVPSDIKRFFHAGQTNWFGTTDLNLVDAILLNATRIGHGFSIVKHPLVMKLIKQRNIAIEINPISNQVLRLVDDMRNHPGTILMARGFPVVIGVDDSMLWNSKGLSYDFYMAFMGMTSRETDLKFLKQLALNSLIYSAMPSKEKEKAIDQWEKEWSAFIHKLVKNNSTTQILIDEL